MNGPKSGLKELLQSSFFPIYRSLVIFFLPMVGLIISNSLEENTVKISPDRAAEVMLMLSLNVWHNVQLTQARLRKQLETVAAPTNSVA